MDIPSLRKKPSYNTVLKYLESLQLKPSLWDATVVPEVTQPEGNATAITFLISVIMNEFEWFQEMKDDAGAVLSVEDQKERLILEASSRMSE
ncbi:hypothetical protein IFR05_001255, partial [Cadophora sp. M221]